MSSGVDRVLIEEHEKAMAREEGDPSKPMRDCAVFYADLFADAFHAALEQLQRRGMDESEAWGAAHQVAAQVLARTMVQ